MTARIFAPDADYFFHSHELRILKADEESITVTLTNKDIMVIKIKNAQEILKDIRKAIEEDEDISFPVGHVNLS